MDGRFRTPIYVEERSNKRTSATNHNLVSKSFADNRRSDYCASTGGNQPTTGYNRDRTRHQSATIYQEGGSSPGIPKVCQGIQRGGIKTLSPETSMGSRHRIQERCPGSDRLQSISYESNRGRSSAKVHHGRIRKRIHP